MYSQFMNAKIKLIEQFFIIHTWKEEQEIVEVKSFVGCNLVEHHNEQNYSTAKGSDTVPTTDL